MLNLEKCYDKLKDLPSLKVLFLGGNPLALALNYKTIVLEWLTELWMFDETEILQT